MIQSVFVIPQHAASIRTTSQQAVSVDSQSKLSLWIPITFQTCKGLFFAVGSSRIYSSLVRLCDTWLCPEGSVALRCALLYHRTTHVSFQQQWFLMTRKISRTYTEVNPPYLLDLGMAMTHTVDARRFLVMTLTTP
jgi:hypothetical protein